MQNAFPRRLSLIFGHNMIKYNPPFTATELLRRLLEADLLRKLDSESFTFSYKYIFYFLVAQKISELVNSGKMMES